MSGTKQASKRKRRSKIAPAKRHQFRRRIADPEGQRRAVEIDAGKTPFVPRFAAIRRASSPLDECIGVRLLSAQQLRQPGNTGSNAPGFVLCHEIGGRAPPGLVLKIDGTVLIPSRLS